MKYRDYSIKLNDHDKYVKAIDFLETKCNYIELVLVNRNDSNELVEMFKDDIILEKKVSEWWGTHLSSNDNSKNKLYRIKASDKLFLKLREYETFCRYHISRNGDYTEITDFGSDDIAFFDDSEEPILFTTTHEGYITVRNDFII